mmetsp:Transcript_98713/g.212921  ORF Transcript_98713/g.212921 Transcript_98713/m.212921 type:complete len:219 (-) Transcript_98713:58-714(-)
MGHRGDDQKHAQVRCAEHGHHVVALLDGEDGGDQRHQQHRNQDDSVCGQLLGADAGDRQRREVQQAHHGDRHGRHDAGHEDRVAGVAHAVGHRQAQERRQHAHERGQQAVGAHRGDAHEALVQQLVLLRQVAYSDPHGRTGSERKHLRVSPAVREDQEADRHGRGMRNLRVDQVFGQQLLVHRVQVPHEGLQSARGGLLGGVAAIAGIVRGPSQGVFR